ncbi:MAG TPA: hypothetical protein VE571_08240, partial [Solirubrobacteraceae bacterium]|nr:hypothetical protein [Solirubrobacteraceae bacterium]
GGQHLVGERVQGLGGSVEQERNAPAHELITVERTHSASGLLRQTRFATTAASTAASSPGARPAQDPSEPATSTGPATASPVTGVGRRTGPISPQAALEDYARLYIDWTAATLAAHQRRLAALSEGTARAKALQAAASYTHDATLSNGRVANRGQIVSITAGRGPARGRWVIVTSEHTTGRGDYQGLPATTHVTYAQLAHTRHGWMVSQWSPQS